MTALAPAAPISRTASRIGMVLTVLITLFLLFDSITKLLQVPDVVAATLALGFAASAVPVIGAVLLGCVVLYLVPRTALLGAVLLTGYLGGAVCTHLRVEAPLFSTLLFPVYFGIVVWVALYLRDATLRAVAARLISRR